MKFNVQILIILVIICCGLIASCSDAAKESSQRSPDGNNWDEMKWDEGKWE